MSERHIELVWRCSSCQHKNLGRHTICEGCGNPKDESEEYEMPADPSAAVSVSDPELLALAKGGENWSCQYCGSDQRDQAGECKRCGGDRTHPAEARAATKEAAARRLAQQAGPPRSRTPLYVLGGLLAVSAFVTLVLVTRRREPPLQPPDPLGLVVERPPPPPPRTTFTAKITGVTWKRTATVETRQLVAHEDFATEVPAGAVEVKAAGQHVHHEDQVLDHEETVYDNVEVPDGTRTESYTERVSCGQDCTTTPRTCRKVCSGSPRSCRQVCTNSKNGFASCKEVCSGSGETCRDDCTGGGQSCKTKYCDERRTRQIPKTRTERRPRQVPHYRSEPRYAAWSTFKMPEWVHTASSDLTGDDTTPLWPDAGVKETDAGTVKLGDRRVVRTETMWLKLTTDDGAAHEYSTPSLADLATMAVGGEHQVRVVDGAVTFLSDD